MSPEPEPAIKPPPPPPARPYGRSNRGSPRGSRIATTLTFAFASVLAVGALLAAAAGALPSLAATILGVLWFALPASGTFGSLYIREQLRTRRVEARDPAAVRLSALGVVFGIGLAMTWAAALVAGFVSAPPVLAAAAPVPMAIALFTAAGPRRSGHRAPRAIAATALAIPLPLAAGALLGGGPALALGLLGSCALALIGAGVAHTWALSDLSAVVPARTKAFIDSDLSRRITLVESRERSVLAREKGVRAREKALTNAPTAPMLPAPSPPPPTDLLLQLEEIATERTRLSTEGLRLRRFQEEVELRHEEVAARTRERESVEREIQQRDQELRHRETELDEFERQLAHQMTEIHAQTARLEEAQREIDARLATVQGREQAVAQAPPPVIPVPKSKSRALKDQAMREREAELMETAAQLVEREKHLESWALKVESRAREARREREYAEAMARGAKASGLTMRGYLDTVARKEASYHRRETEFQGALVGLEALRETVNESLGRAGVLQKEIQNRNAMLVSREAEMQTREEQLQQREMEFTALAASLASGQVRGDRVLELRERLLREREEQFTRKNYEKEKEREIQQTVQNTERLALVNGGTEAQVAALPVGSRAKSGIPRFDELLGGGIPWKSTFLAVGPAFVGKQVFVGRILAEGVRRREPAIIVTTSRPPVEVAEDMTAIDPGFLEADRDGLIYWIDASARTDSPGRPIREMNRLRVDGAGDFHGIYEAVVLLETEFKARRIQRFRFAYLALSQSLMHTREGDPTEFFQMLSNRLRQTQHLGIYVVESGILSERQHQVLEHLCDGSVVFRKETQRNYLAVQGLTDVLTRDWVPYQFTQKSLHLGAFNLERIK